MTKNCYNTIIKIVSIIKIVNIIKTVNAIKSVSTIKTVENTCARPVSKQIPAGIHTYIIRTVQVISIRDDLAAP